MRRAPLSTVTSRAIVGAVALYALLLQAFLAAGTPAVPFDPAHLLCAPGNGPSGASHPAGGDSPLHRDGTCCTAAPASGPFSLPGIGVTAVRVLPRIIAAAWHPAETVPRTGPPTHAHSPRGPPAA